MDVPDSVAEELQRRQLGLIIVWGPQNLQIGRDTREEALRSGWAGRGGDRLDGARHVDEVFLRSLPGVIGPRAGIRKRVEGRIESDQPGDFIPGLIVEFLQGDLADDLVA